jgi:hypothetical protein
MLKEQSHEILDPFLFITAISFIKIGFSGFLKIYISLFDIKGLDKGMHLFGVTIS